jgi:CopG family transcriptional regulator, nickel-responsive regulator
MQRVTITLDDALMDELDAIIAARGYQNRSEAIRDLARAGIREAAEDVSQKRDCVAALVYTYDHTCLEVTVLRGRTDDVLHFGEHVIAERGVRHGKIVRMPFEPAKTRRVSHGHGHHHAHGHDGRKPVRRVKRLRKAER